MSNFLIGDHDLIIDEILSYMSEFNFLAPEKWDGSRIIESKI
jgi:hypothetical protein